MPRYKNTPFLNISFCSALVLLVAFTSAIAADVDTPLQQSLTPGMRVRILAPGVAPNKVIGTVEKVSDDAVTLNIPGRSEPVSILREKIARLDVSEGPRSRGVDAAIGAGIGAGVGAIVGAVADSNQKKNQVVNISDGAVAGAGALFGALVGAVIGAAVPPGERWKEIAATRYRVSFAPRLDHGADLAVAWKF
jgi:hypothetical protein